VTLTTPPERPPAAGPTLRQAYEAFVALDRAEEIAGNRHQGIPRDRMERAWDRWSRVPYGLFLEWAGQVAGLASAIEVGRVTGSFTTGLRLVRCLRDAGLAEVDRDGALRWRQPDWPLATAAVPEDAARLLTGLLEPVEVGRFGQCAVDVGSTIRRGRRIAEEVGALGLPAAFLGDADLASVAAASAVAAPVTVVDVDELVLAHLATARERLALANLEVVAHDLSRPLPEALTRRFAACVIDPIDNGWGIELWLSRVLEALRGEERDRIYISINAHRIGRRLLALVTFLACQGFVPWAFDHEFHDWPLPTGDDDEHTRPVVPQAAALGVAREALAAGRIYTDLLVFVRVVRGPSLLPQDHVDIRRAI
jgi:hypothetical protein